MRLSTKGSSLRYLADHGVVTTPASLLGKASPNRAESTSGDVTTVTLPAMSGHRHVIYGIVFSYDVTPDAGLLTVTRGASTVIEKQAVTAAGPGPLPLPMPLHGEVNEAMTIVLAASTGAVGRLTVYTQPIPG